MRDLKIEKAFSLNQKIMNNRGKLHCLPCVFGDSLPEQFGMDHWNKWKEDSRFFFFFFFWSSRKTELLSIVVFWIRFYVNYFWVHDSLCYVNTHQIKVPILRHVITCIAHNSSRYATCMCRYIIVPRTCQTCKNKP